MPRRLPSPPPRTDSPTATSSISPASAATCRPTACGWSPARPPTRSTSPASTAPTAPAPVPIPAAAAPSIWGRRSATTGRNYRAASSARKPTSPAKARPQGIANAATLTFTSVSGNACQAMALFKDTGTAGTSKLIALISGDFIVTAAQTAASSATTIYVDKLPYGIANGTRAHLQQRPGSDPVRGSSRRRPPAHCLRPRRLGDARQHRARAAARLGISGHAQRQQYRRDLGLRRQQNFQIVIINPVSRRLHRITFNRSCAIA